MKQFKRILPIAILICLLFCLLTNPVFASSKYEYYDSGDDNWKNIFDINWESQTFTPASSHTITSVVLKLGRRDAGAPGQVVVEIQETTAGVPNGSVLCSGTLAGSTVVAVHTAGDWYTITLGAGAALTASTVYAIVVSDPTSSGSNRLAWRYDDTVPSYSGGKRGTSGDSGGTWSQDSSDDAMFEEWGDPAGSAPTVTTQAADTVSYSTATTNGNVTNLNGGGNCTIEGFGYDVHTHNGDNLYAYDKHSHGDFGTGAFHEHLTGLIPNTLYYYKPYAINPAGTGWGTSELTFTTTNNIETDAASGITYTAATLNAELLDMAGDASYVVSFDYGATSAYESGNVVADESPMVGVGTFHTDLSGLADGLHQHYRAKGVGDVTGTRYGADMTFNTLEEDPTVTTQAASGITMDKDGVTGGQFNGTLVLTGDNATVDVTFEYDTDSGAPYANETAPHEELAAPGAFFKAVPVNLVPGTTYYYRSKAVGVDHGTVYGAEQSFTFTMPTFTTTAETIVTPGAATAQLNGNISNMQKASNVYAYFIWGYTNACIEGSTTPQTLAGAGDFHDHITGFLRNVTIYYKAELENHPTTSTGAAESFLIAPPALAEVLWYQPNDIIVNTDDDSTADGGSNATTIIDAERTEGNDFWNFALLTILTTTDGLAPQGETAVITDFLAASDELQFAALTDTVDVGDTYRVEFGTLPDRDSTQDGIITWGTDDGLTITYGGIGGGGEGDALTSSIDWWDMPESTMPSTWYANGENVASLPFYDNFSEVATQMGMPVVIFYFWFIIGLAFGTMLLLAVFTRSALLGVVGMNVVLFIGSSMTVIPMWIPFAILITQIGIMYLYKQVSY